MIAILSMQLNPSHVHIQRKPPFLGPFYVRL